MSQVVKIPVVEQKRPLVARISIYSFIVICIIFFTIIISSNSTALIVISIFFVISSGLIMLLFKKFLIEGYIVFHTEKIVIKTKTLDQDISVRHLTELKFIYGGFDGDFYSLNPKSISVKNGTDNYITLQNGNKKYSFELFLTESNLKPLSNILNNWKKINPNFVIIGQWGFKVKSL